LLHVLFALQVPPSPAFIALGMAVTDTELEPPPTTMRCVPMAWVEPTRVKPKQIWNDSGTGGKRGSVWTINSLGLMCVTQGHEVPKGPFYEFKSTRMFMGPDNKDEIKAFSPQLPTPNSPASIPALSAKPGAMATAGAAAVALPAASASADQIGDDATPKRKTSSKRMSFLGNRGSRPSDTI
jgi:hypothetical protein